MRRFNYSFNFCDYSDDDLRQLKVSSVSVIAPLLVDELLCLFESPATIVRDVSYVAQNLSKFQNVSDVQQASIVERLRSTVPASANFTDEELFSHMKSRYCQLPSEVDSYLNYINSNIDLINKSLSEEFEVGKSKPGELNSGDSSAGSSPAASV